MAITYVQSLATPFANGGNASTIPITTTAAVTAGNRIVAKFFYTSTFQTVSGVSGGGLTWTVDAVGNFGGGAAKSNVVIASAPAPAGLASGTVITCTLSGLANAQGATLDEYSGIATSSPTDGSAVASGPGSLTADPTVGPITTTLNGDLIVAAFYATATRTTQDTFTPGSGYTARNSLFANGFFQAFTEDQVQSTAGSISATANDATGTASFESAMVAYKDASAGPPPSNTVAPAVTGTAALGSTLTSDNGSWSGSPSSFSYQWQRSSDGGTTWVNLSTAGLDSTDATTHSHVVVGFDVGSVLRCVVTATNANGSTPANSNATSEVPAPSGAPSYRLVAYPVAQSDNQIHSTNLAGAVLPHETMVLVASSSVGNIGGDMGSVSDPNSNTWTLDFDAGPGAGAGKITQALSAQNGATKLQIGATITNKIKQTTVVGANALNSTTINVVSTAGFDAAGTVNIGAGGGGVAVTYTGITPTSLTGCGSHAALTGGEVIIYHGQSPYYAIYALNPGDGSGTKLTFDGGANTHVAAPTTPAAGPITTAKGAGVAFTLGALGTPDTNHWMTPGTGWAVSWAGFQAAHGGTDSDGISNTGESGYKAGVEGRTYSAAGTSLTGAFTSDAGVGGGQDAMVVAYGFDPAGGGTPPANTVTPVVSGTTVQGSLLSTTDGTWTGSPAPTFGYQWQRDVGGNGVFSNISAATANTYTLAAADVGNDVRCVVTGTNASGSASANSNAVGPITAPPAAPVNTAAPVVNGSTVQGSGLTVSDGTWTGSPAPTFTYQWQRDVAGNGVFSNISAATSNAYTLVAGDVGNDIRCAVTGTNASGSASANSNVVGPIQPPPAPSNIAVIGGFFF